jgi:restriction system protein
LRGRGMGRRGIIYSIISASQKEARRSAAARAKAEREAERLVRKQQQNLKKLSVALEKEKKNIYIEERLAEVKDLNNDLSEKIYRLENILTKGFENSSPLNFSKMKIKSDIPKYDPGSLLEVKPQPSLNDYLPKNPNSLMGLFKSVRSKHEDAIENAKNNFERAMEEYSKQERDRTAALEDYKRNYQIRLDKIVDETNRINSEIDKFEIDVRKGEPIALAHYFTLILERGEYPEDFPDEKKIAFLPESKQLIIEMDLPTIDVIPKIKTYTYIKSEDKLKETALPGKQIKTLYSFIIPSIALRVLTEIFNSDVHKHVETIVYNGYVNTINKANGKIVRPCLVTLRVTRDIFNSINIRNVDPIYCLKSLNASISKDPSELIPVRPVLEFNMVDPRFVEEADVLSTLDKRPNLMDLTPKEFESLITNLFEKMGLETRLTVPSRDGGVDCVAFDPRPIFGGKVVIQAKRYKNTVGVSAVRDLFGTMQNEGASKGILVTTSGYGKASFEFAEGKPIELLSGSNLLYLLSEYAKIDAKIVPPDDWRDPDPDKY